MNLEAKLPTYNSGSITYMSFSYSDKYLAIGNSAKIVVQNLKTINNDVAEIKSSLKQNN